MADSFLRLAGIRKAFGDHIAVHHFDLDVREGELVSFLGPSGCGKTTTLRMIAGFESPSEGLIQIDAEDVTRLPPNRRDVGMVFQSYALFPNMCVADNIGFGLRMRRESKARTRERVAELLELINLSEAARRFPYQLSGGMQQRVALARALAIEPRVLLLDEPLSALDAKIRASLRIEIRAIQQRLGITTVYVTHDQEEALSLSDRVVVMSQGRIEQVGTPADVYNRPASDFVARFVGTLNVLEGQVVDAERGYARVGHSILQAAEQLKSHSNGERIVLAMRPEAISCDAFGAQSDAADQATARNLLLATVEEVTFLGPVVRTTAKLEDGDGRVIADGFNDPSVASARPGQRVRLGFSPDALIVIPERPPPVLDVASGTILDSRGAGATNKSSTG